MSTPTSRSAATFSRDEAIEHFEKIAAIQAEIIRDCPRTRDHPLPPGEDDICRGRNCPDESRRQGVQADQLGRRLLARRPQKRAAAAHHAPPGRDAQLQDYCDASRKGERDTAGSAGDDRSIPGRGRDCGWHPPADPLPHAESYRRRRMSDGYRRSAAAVLDARCGRSPATGSSTARNVVAEPARRDAGREADERRATCGFQRAEVLPRLRCGLRSWP